MCMNIILHLCLGLQSGRFPAGFSTNDMTSPGPLHSLLVAVLCCCGMAVGLPDVIRIGQSEFVVAAWTCGVSVTTVTRLPSRGSIASKRRDLCLHRNVQTVCGPFVGG